jgi:hypothetical protein
MGIGCAKDGPEIEIEGRGRVRGGSRNGENVCARQLDGCDSRRVRSFARHCPQLWYVLRAPAHQTPSFISLTIPWINAAFFHAFETCGRCMHMIQRQPHLLQLSRPSPSFLSSLPSTPSTLTNPQTSIQPTRKTMTPTAYYISWGRCHLCRQMCRLERGSTQLLQGESSCTAGRGGTLRLMVWGTTMSGGLRR